MKILVVDDSAIIRRILKNVLAEAGYKDIIEAADGVEAWELLQKNLDVKLIMTDWNMPNMNGLELVKKIRADERFKDVPIVMVTTEGGKKEVIMALKAGVNNYIVKPFDKKKLKEKLQQVLGKNEE
jgi:two-component system chemotaxis response regulator CheY